MQIVSVQIRVKRVIYRFRLKKLHANENENLPVVLTQLQRKLHHVHITIVSTVLWFFFFHTDRISKIVHYINVYDLCSVCT